MILTPVPALNCSDRQRNVRRIFDSVSSDGSSDFLERAGRTTVHLSGRFSKSQAVPPLKRLQLDPEISSWPSINVDPFDDLVSGLHKSLNGSLAIENPRLDNYILAQVHPFKLAEFALPSWRYTMSNPINSGHMYQIR